MIYNAVGENTRRVMAIVSSLAIVGLLAWSLPAVWDYLALLHRFNKPNPTLKFPFTDKPILVAHIYSVYLIFAAAIILRYTIRAIRLIFGARLEDIDPPAPTETTP
jgi:C4-dicarboxylate transporter, DctQ subunit